MKTTSLTSFRSFSRHSVTPGYRYSKDQFFRERQRDVLLQEKIAVMNDWRFMLDDALAGSLNVSEALRIMFNMNSIDAKICAHGFQELLSPMMWKLRR